MRIGRVALLSAVVLSGAARADDAELARKNALIDGVIAKAEQPGMWAAVADGTVRNTKSGLLCPAEADAGLELKGVVVIRGPQGPETNLGCAYVDPGVLLKIGPRTLTLFATDLGGQKPSPEDAFQDSLPDGTAMNGLFVVPAIDSARCAIIGKAYGDLLETSFVCTAVTKNWIVSVRYTRPSTEVPADLDAGKALATAMLAAALAGVELGR